MDKRSKLESRLETLVQKVPEKYRRILLSFYHCYQKAILDAGQSFDAMYQPLFTFLEQIEPQFEHPYSFEPYHQKVRAPFDFYRFGLDFMRPLINLSSSQVLGLEQVDAICSQLKKGENVILLANHQTEADPQIISLLLERTHPQLAEQIIYVAGERVVTDPMAIPLSMGCDLLCIYSKRYIDHPPEGKAKKLLHNKNTMERMRRLLQEGGKIIYVAPSGGRDRKNEKGHIDVASFDPQSIEMFYLMAKKAKTPTHFYPFSLSTYEIMPPPESIQKELGELRFAKYGPAHLAFAPEFDFEGFSPSIPDSGTTSARDLYRQERAHAIWKIVDHHYQTLIRLP